MEKFKINYEKNALEENYLKIKLDPKYVNLIKKVHATEKEVKTNLSSFEDSIIELENCKNCKCLSECKNKIKGYVYYPQKKESTLTTAGVSSRSTSKLSTSFKSFAVGIAPLFLHFRKSYGLILSNIDTICA